MSDIWNLSFHSNDVNLILMHLQMSHVTRKPVFGVPDQLDSNRPAQLES